MTTPSLRAALLALLCGCVHAAAPPPLVANRAAVQAVPSVAASYWCSIDEASYAYPRFPCTIAPRRGRLVLEKLGGSQRFRGVVEPDGRGGFGFVGEFYCPWGDCTQPVRTHFTPAGGGALVARFDANLSVRLEPAAPGAFGGAGYGGAGYGGYGYGGAGYGGYGYGGALGPELVSPMP